jgi:hypothetical protein
MVQEPRPPSMSMARRLVPNQQEEAQVQAVN